MLLEIVQWMHRNSIVLMMAIFVVIALAAFCPGNRSRLEKGARIPLHDDQ
jgi:cbb3-type cytochrome oxidase subunit 3